MQVLSLSLDASIATTDGESRDRQRRYAEHFDSYTVVVKTDAGEGNRVEDGPLTVVPTSSSSRYGFLIDAYRLSAREIDQRGVDVVTVQTPFASGLVGWALAKRYDVKLHTQVHIDFLDNPQWRSRSIDHRIFEPIARFVLPRSDAVRVGTTYEKSKIERIVPDDVPVTVAPVTVDVDGLVDGSPDGTVDVRSHFDLSNRQIVLFAGRFVEQKDFDTWITVARRVAASRSDPPVFVLTGDGPELDRVRRNVERLQIADSFCFPGWVDRSVLASFYDTADVFLITSYYEGTSRVLIEAGLNELPVVATPFAGAHDNVWDGETGFVAADVDALAEQVCRLLDDPELGASFGRRARERLEERFDPDRLVEEYVSFLTCTS